MGEQESIRAEVRYLGRVQGVGFRATVRDLARAYPELGGWVRNEPEGSVFLVLEGAEPRVNELLAAISGRMAGWIERSSRSDARVQGESGFEIRR